MPQLARAFDEAIDPEFVSLPPAPAGVVAPWGEAEPGDSPARALHQRLIDSFEARPAAVDDRLPLQVRLAIVTAAILGPWLVGGALYLAF